MRLKLRIQSFSDVITNSSSELFILQTNENTVAKDEIQKLIDKHATEHYWKGDWDEFKKLDPKERLKWNTCSGDGGSHEVRDAHDRYLEWIEYHKNGRSTVEEIEKAIPYDVYVKYFDYRGEDYLYIDIDHSYCATINFILENFVITENSEYGCYEIDPNTKRILRLVTLDEYEALPEEKQLH